MILPNHTHMHIFQSINMSLTVNKYSHDFFCLICFFVQKIATLEATCSSLQGQLEELKNDKEISTKDFDENVQLERYRIDFA